MSVKIRLTRLGDIHTPFYRVVVADSRVARDGKVIETIGTYNPMTNPETIKIDVELAKKWIANGAAPTDTAKQLLVKSGIKFKASKTKTTKPAILKAKKNSKKK